MEKKILVVDDDFYNRYLMSKILIDMGYRKEEKGNEKDDFIGIRFGYFSN